MAAACTFFERKTKKEAYASLSTRKKSVAHIFAVLVVYNFLSLR